MEKSYEVLLRVKYQELIRQIVSEVRQAACAIPVFRDSKNGCIRITIVPLTPIAEAWIGGELSDFELFDREHMGHPVHDICEREFVYPIFPGGSHTIQYECEDGHIEPVNCYGYSALKTAYASWKRRFDELTDNDTFPETLSDLEFRRQTEFFTEDNGWSMHRGSLWITANLDGEPFMRLYVCVSGAKSLEDEQCALFGLRKAIIFLSEIDQDARIVAALVERPEEKFAMECVPDFLSVQDT